ncbi:DUF6174 domain-containing protein [Thalassotalea sp. PLHSN55]|uniref:DUF6174 domain-containing protein n=1 Tax=Thalassotalea sp. PLHSN55 TaxID=3435888 RepID=UPI003F856AF0
MNSKYLVFLCLLGLEGCDNSSDENQNQNVNSLIQENENVWLDSGVKSYTFTYVSSPSDCPTADPFPPVEITVINGNISSIYVPEFGEFLEIENTTYPTIDEIFEHMLESADTIKGMPVFDDNFGYPISYSSDLSSAECDARSVLVSSFI